MESKQTGIAHYIHTQIPQRRQKILSHDMYSPDIVYTPHTCDSSK